ncbi:regulator of sigma E protease [Trypanosoma cruzi]|nr:regulator of sigma E protease [Trypanosoma cruzi]
MLRLAMRGWVNRQHGPSGARRCGWRCVRKIKRREKYMAPVTGRPSSSVAHGSAHTPPSAAATYTARIGNTRATMPSSHREPTANAARGKWRHNQRTLQWPDEQTIRMQLHSSRDSLLVKDITVRRG